jgi:hypothetical protein
MGHCFGLNSKHQPVALIPPETTRQPEGVRKLLHRSQRWFPFGLFWYCTSCFLSWLSEEPPDARAGEAATHPIVPPMLAASTSTRRREKLAVIGNSDERTGARLSHPRPRRLAPDDYSTVVEQIRRIERARQSPA